MEGCPRTAQGGDIMIGNGLLFYVFYIIVSSLGLAVGTVLVYWVVDKSTPYLSFAQLSKDKPYLMFLLVSVILVCLTWLMKAVSINIIPVP